MNLNALPRQIFQVPHFKAQPLPKFDEVHLPEKKVAEPTKPAPFKLMIDERGAAKGERWEQMVRSPFEPFLFIFHG